MSKLSQKTKAISVIVFAFVISLEVLIFNKTAFGLDPQKAITQYIHDILDSKDGLPQNTVVAITQTRDGYMWFGTQEGLARFDGVRFTVFSKDNTEQIKHNFVTGLLEGQDGSLWVGTLGGLVRLKDGGFSSYTTKDGLAGDRLHALYEDKAGNLWIGTEGGLSKLKDGQLTSFTTKEGIPSDVVHWIFEDRRSVLWVNTRGGVYRLIEGRFTQLNTRDGLFNHEFVGKVFALCEDREGNFWFRVSEGPSAEKGLYRLKDGQLTKFTTQDGLSDIGMHEAYEDRAGNLWFSTPKGLNRFTDGKFTHFTTKDGLSNDKVDAIYEDREGNLWVGTYGGGINRFTDGKFTFFTTKEGLTSDLIRAIYEGQEGSLWIATNVAGVNRFKDGKFTALTSKDGLINDTTRSLYQDRAGSLWVGNEGGLNRLKDGKVTHFTTKDGLPDNVILAIFEDQNGSLWIGTYNGLARLQSGKFTSYTTKDGLSSNTVRAIHEDKEGNLWIGTYGGLNRFRDGKFSILSTQDSPFTGIVQALFEDQEGSLWIGTWGSGLFRFKDGEMTRYTKKEGLFDDSVFSIVEDDQGNLWMTSNTGIFRAGKGQLNDFAAGRVHSISCTSYGIADGLRSLECTGGFQPASSRTRDGRLWFPTNKGLAMIDPNNIKSNPLPPPVYIEQTVIDKKIINPKEKTELGPGVKELEFHYTALSFLFPQRVGFKYKLEGFDSEWVDADTRRVAYYTNLSPGEYRFRVIACNNDGVWNETGATLDFYLKPHFYQTYWFYGLCIFALTLLGLAGYRVRVRQFEARERELGAKVVERTAQLKQKNEELEGAKDAAEAASQAKSVFLANMSHELRSPLNAILGFARLVTRHQALPHEAREDLGIILRSGEHLHTLINQVLDLSKIEAGRASLTESDFDLHQLLDELEDMFAFTAQDKGLQLLFDRGPDVPHYVRADQVKLRQVLINLLSNAIKFTAEGSVTLHVRMKDEGGGMKDEFGAGEPATGVPTRGGSRAVAPRGEGMKKEIEPQFILHFSVTDTGCGIAEEELSTIFGPFVQAQAGRLSKEGTGLGLAISRSFVRLMGGQIQVETHLGQGTNLSFDIPVSIIEASIVAESKERSHRRVVALAAGQPRYRILVVDDRWASRYLLIRLLAPLGFELREATNGEEAIAVWDEWHPDLICMDLRMPVMDGREATRRIRLAESERMNAKRAAQNEEQEVDPSSVHHCKIIALTASSFEEERANVLAEGCDDFLRKPFREADLFELMQKHLGARFEYGEEPTAIAVAPPEVDRAALGRLPMRVVRELESALVQLDPEAVSWAIEEVRGEDGRLAEWLASLAADFQYERILSLIQGRGGGSGGEANYDSRA